MYQGSITADEGYLGQLALRSRKEPLAAFAIHGGVRSVAGPILRTQKLCKDFGPVRVLFDMEFELQPGEIHAVIG